MTLMKSPDEIRQLWRTNKITADQMQQMLAVQRNIHNGAARIAAATQEPDAPRAASPSARREPRTPPPREAPVARREVRVRDRSRRGSDQ